MTWTVGFVNRAAESELNALPDDMRAHFARIAVMIRDHGLPAMREPYVKHLMGKLWEIRMKGRDGIARSIYATASGKRVVVLRTFVKKTEKTPTRDNDCSGAREGDRRMRSFDAWLKQQLKNPAFKREYKALEEEFTLAGELIGARARAKLTQAEVARRMGTSQSAVARMESGRALPSTASLRKYAKAVGHRVVITLKKAA